MTGSEVTPLHRRDRHPADAWLNPAEHDQLRRDLADLPELHDQLARHYPELRGNLAALDLTGRRPPGAATLADPIGEADLANRVRARRHGALQTLESWVRLADGEMWDDDHDHDPPAPTPTVTTEAGWLARHLDWIARQQWVIELWLDARTLVIDLERIVGPAYARPLPDAAVLATAADLAPILHVPASTVRRWVADGRIPQAVDGQGNPHHDAAGRRLHFVADAQAYIAGRRRRLRNLGADA